MEQNGSASVEFDTVDERVYLTAIVRKHEGFEDIETNLLQKNETSLKQVLKTVLGSKDYEKLYPIIENIEKNRQITIQEVMDIVNKLFWLSSG